MPSAASDLAASPAADTGCVRAGGDYDRSPEPVALRKLHHVTQMRGQDIEFSRSLA